MSSNFKLDLFNPTLDESINKLQSSKTVGFKSVNVVNNLSVGKLNINKSHITSTDKYDPTI